VAQKQKSIGKLTLRRKTLKQNQLNRDHAEVQRDIKLAGGDPETVRLGSPNSRRKSSGAKSQLRYLVRTPKGAEVVLIQADTHAIWDKHQTDEAGAAAFGAMLKGLSVVGKFVQLDILKVELIQTGGVEAAEATDIDF